MRCGPAPQPETLKLRSFSRPSGCFFQHSSAVTKILLGVLLGENLPYRAKSDAPKVPIVFH